MPGRKPLNRTSLHARVAPETADKLKKIALALGYVYDEEGSIGQLMDAIALGEVLLVSTKDSDKSR